MDLFQYSLQLKPYLLSFLFLFLAFDVFGVFSAFYFFSVAEKRKQKIQETFDLILLTASILLGFIFLSRFIFALFEISTLDFTIFAAIALFLLSLAALFRHNQKRAPHYEGAFLLEMAALLLRPQVFIAALCLTNFLSLFAAVISLLVCLILCVILLHNAAWTVKALGLNFVFIFSKCSNILLAALSVVMLRTAIFDLLSFAAKVK
jgi:small neutral amino acid transporter SnatA (MarC family)